ncbi:MAG: hypothetical protein K2I07_08810 [Lachnospiraceae bacterium]|nr:hypothetical protein [Lachnospiraceae bacterium]
MKKKTYFNDFLYCGLLGWMTEILFTAFHTFKRRDYSLKGITSLWMFPIYGLSACLYPISAFLKKHRVKTSVRGLLYTLCIFSVEFISGSILDKRKRCPWNYYRSPYHVRGVIRLDYAPCWFGFSLLMEKLLWKRHAAKSNTPPQS